MAFAQGTEKVRDGLGRRRVIYGTFTQISGDTGGAITTGLYSIDYFECTAALNVSVSGGTVTVTTADPGAAQAGYWMAVGL